MKQLLFVLSFFFLLGCKNDLKGEVKIVSPQEMQLILQLYDVQLIDVRTPKEYDESHIANSQNIDYFSPTFLEDIDRLDKNKIVLVYCRSGKRSAKCVEKLEEAGFKKIYDLDGGISKWKHEGFEVVPKL